MLEKTLLQVVLVAFAYLLGSLPYGYWFAKLTKGPDFDIRDHGSCSIGFTNVLRILGWKTAVPVFVADFLKGFVPAILGSMLAGPIFGAVCLLVAALGHAKSAYFFWKEGVFSGGKSAASMLGGIFAIDWKIGLVCTGVFLVVLVISRIVSVSTISAAASALVFTFLVGNTAAWKLIYAIVLVLILYTHKRNIGRLFAGIEPPIGHVSDDPEIVSAFVLHPLSREDFDQILLTRWINPLVNRKVISERQLDHIIAMSPVLENSQITGIHTKDGKNGRALILAIPLLPHQIQDPKYRLVLDSLLKAAAVQAQRRGASVLTLGALLSSYSNGGTDLYTWCRKRGLTIKIDNGAACTVAATKVVALERLQSRGIALDQAKVGIVGDSGLIGRRSAEEFEILAGDVVPLHRKRDERGVKIDIDLSELRDCDLVIFATSSPDPIVTRENYHLLNPDVTIVDAAVPTDVARDVPLDVIRSGLIRLPGNPVIDMDFHFGSEDGVPLVPACLAQGWILAATERFEHASRGARLRHEDVLFFEEACQKLGFRIVVSGLSEPEIFGKTS